MTDTLPALAVYVPELFDPYDDLLERKTDLERQTYIPDIRAYACAWLQLAETFESCGLVGCEAYCRGKYDQYKALPGGAYFRVHDAPFAELVEWTK